MFSILACDPSAKDNTGEKGIDESQAPLCFCTGDRNRKAQNKYDQTSKITVAIGAGGEAIWGPAAGEV